jgi:hypothetical protein
LEEEEARQVVRLAGQDRVIALREENAQENKKKTFRKTDVAQERRRARALPPPQQTHAHKYKRAYKHKQAMALMVRHKPTGDLSVLYVLDYCSIFVLPSLEGSRRLAPWLRLT